MVCECIVWCRGDCCGVVGVVGGCDQVCVWVVNVCVCVCVCVCVDVTGVGDVGVWWCGGGVAVGDGGYGVLWGNM